MTIEISVPDAKELLKLLKTSPKLWRDVIDELDWLVDNALEEEKE